jgi:hypothetical protein
MTMTEKERTITKHELSAVLLAIDIKVSAMKEIMEAAFPPSFTPKEGEVIWVRDGEDERWVLRIFISKNDYYCCEADNMLKWFDWRQAKPQTPTQKGEG